MENKVREASFFSQISEELKSDEGKHVESIDNKRSRLFKVQILQDDEGLLDVIFVISKVVDYTSPEFFVAEVLFSQKFLLVSDANDSFDEDTVFIFVIHFEYLFHAQLQRIAACEIVLTVSLNIFFYCLTIFVFDGDVRHVHSIAIHHVFYHLTISILNSHEQRGTTFVVSHIHHFSVCTTIKVQKNFCKNETFLWAALSRYVKQ